MFAEVKKCAENHDVKGLRYIFVDCLDVDPTFEKYKEDYEYCKSIPGMFDRHQELSGLVTDKGRWTMKYWEQLKLDLMKNFSQKRFEHMVSVAKVVYAEKIERILKERAVLRQNKSEGTKRTVMPEKKNQVDSNIVINESNSVEDRKKRDQERIAAKRRELEEHNRRVEAEEAAQRAKSEIVRREETRGRNLEDDPKKVSGIVVAVIAVAVVIVVLIIIALQ